MIRKEISRINWKTAVECWQLAHGGKVPGDVEAVKVSCSREYNALLQECEVDDEIQKSGSI